MDEYQSYKIEDMAGVLIHRAVVRGTAVAGGVKKPSGAGEGKVVGITQEAQATQYASVPVKCAGLSYAVMYGSGAYGDALEVADNTGRLRSCQAALVDLAESTAYVTYVVGFAEKAWTATDDVILVRIAPFAKCTPVT